jgi:hypothetical protein
MVTEKYVGDDSADLYIKRVENSEPFKDKENARFALTPLALGKTSKRAIDKYMNTHGMDESDPKARKTTSHELRLSRIAKSLPRAAPR